jgi:hypothetical protein
MRYVVPVALVLLLVSIGCSRQAPSRPEAKAAPMEAMAPAPDMVAQAPAGGANQPPAGAKKPEQPRKIRYTADLRVIVEDFAKAEPAFMAALKEAKGHVAHSEVGGSPSQGRMGTWRVRVPVDQFDAFRDAVRQLGEVERDTADSEDMTEEFYDLEAHVKNRQAEEEALRELLKDKGKSLSDILLIQEKVNQVRDDINRKQGRLKLLANLTDLTTVTVQLREKQRYNAPAPPALAERPSFSERAVKVFTDSWESLKTLGEFVALAVIGVTPWIPVLLVFGLGGWLIARRMKVNRPVPAASTPAPGQP